MNPQNGQNDLRQMKKAITRLSGAVLILSIGVLVSLVVNLSQVGNVRTYFVPPTVDRAFWIERDRASAEYYEQMASYVAWLVLDVSPANIEWKRDALLAWVAPEHHGEMKTRIDVEAVRLRSNNASTSFEIQQLNTDAKAQTVMLTGRLRRQINGTDVGEAATRSYLAQFAFTGGRVHIKTFTEVPNGPMDKALESVASARTDAR